MKTTSAAAPLVVLLFQLWFGAVSGFPATEAPLTAGLIDAFSDVYNLEYITLDLSDGDAQLLLLIRKHLRKYVSFQSANAKLNATRWSLFPNLHIRFGLLDEGEKRASLLNHLDKEKHDDYWLLHVPPTAEKDQLTRVLNTLPLELTSNIYLFTETFASGDSNTISGFTLDEVYKIRPTWQAKQVPYARWEPGTGLQQYENLTIWERRFDLEGLELKISVLPSPPYLSLGETAEGNLTMSGLFPDVFFVLQNILNFTFVLSTPPDGNWGNLLDDGSYNGMIGQVMRHEIDLSPTSFTITNMRSQVVDFALPIVEMHHRFFIKNPEDGFNWTAYLDPLAWEVWVALLAFTVVIPPLLWCAVRKFNDAARADFKLYRSFFFVATAMSMAKPWSAVPAAGLPKFIFLNVLLSGTFIYWHWEAMLISFLAVKMKTLPFETLPGLMTETDLKIAVVPGTSFADAFRFSPDPMWTRAWSERIAPSISTYPNSKSELVDLISGDESLTLYDNYFSIITFPAYKNCEIIDIPVQYDPKAFAYAFQKNSPLLPLFNHYLNVLRESGNINMIFERYVSSEAPQCEETSGTALGFDNCFTAFLILIAGIVFSLVAFGMEMVDRDRRCLSHFHDEDDIRSRRTSFHVEAFAAMPSGKMALLLEEKDRQMDRLRGEVSRLYKELAFVRSQEQYTRAGSRMYRGSHDFK